MGIVLKVGRDTAFDMSSFGPFSGEFGSADIVTFTSTKVVGYAYGTKVTIAGSGFKANGDGYIVGGTIKSVTETYGGELQLSLSGLSLSVTKLVEVLQTVPTWDERNLIKQVMAGNDKVYGSAENDILVGHGGNDLLVSREGADTIYGNAGNDRLSGGAGADRLFGGSGADMFVFEKAKYSTGSSDGRDTIKDFNRTQGDKIDLAGIDANTKIAGNQAFKFIGENDFHKKAGELRYEQKSNGTYIYGDINGDGKVDLSIKVGAVVDFVKGDFIL
ncbi:type I secretion C-terminal target domain-containing protein [Shinella curvata]|uniref:Type I secretion C-terminal target domain-containing protein n=1 Tax=Shinella curvata TaxID=1817964 RepID=A0ABT8XIB7_9HYPH|nr:type I secretion C-terminal target domain-containing protein [Shinella curvata]MCJ8053866.1 type I secretion C-terminal target domain-containing protein [Shinella curvata]MDO6123198.1 type I secretion C-terminal target domain-containing protein [Shinella curvata]